MKSILIIIGKSLILFSLLFLCYNLFILNFDEINFFEKIIYPSLFITILLTVIHIIASINAGVKYNYSSVQTTNISSHSKLELDELMNKIEEKSKWKLIKKSTDNLVYKSNFNSLKSFGEIISINLSEKEVSISSKPILFTTIFDFGKNYENIKFIKSII